MKAASALYNQIVQHFEAGDGINPDYLLQDLVTRKLRPGESVSAYVDDVGRKGHQCVDVDATDRQCVDADAVGRQEDAGPIDRQCVGVIEAGRHQELTQQIATKELACWLSIPALA
ncbi:hypothetical protein PF006_g12504 [Phytophthora fragariae]|nr:hypothetical protein PF006_g12504 [Phytophthora fragariae]